MSFASCSTDKIVYVCQIDELRPIKAFKGHSEDINCVRWDQNGTFLASCSDDSTVRVCAYLSIFILIVTYTDQVWSLDKDVSIVCFAHDDKITALQWCPPIAGKNPMLAR